MIDRLLAICPSSIPQSRQESWRDARPADRPTVDGSTAIIQIRGVLQRGRSLFQWYDSVDLDSLAELLDAIRLDRRISRCILVFDSPGGTVAGTETAANAIAKLSEAKPTIGFVDGLCASGAYWLASQTRRIVALQTSLVGSIGVYLVAPDYSQLFRQSGIKINVVKAGELKGTGVLGTEFTAQQLDFFQTIVDAQAELFIAAVVRGRRVPEGIIRGTADGRVYLAADAVSYKLIDGIGSFESALADLRKMPAPLTGDETLSHYQSAGFEKLDAKRKELLLAIGSESELQNLFPQFCQWHRDSMPKKPYTFGRPA